MRYFCLISYGLRDIASKQFYIGMRNTENEMSLLPQRLNRSVNIV